jgi:hypothetical protein
MNLRIWPGRKSAPPVKELPEMSDEFVKVPELREPLIPLSILELDLAEAPASGWPAYLAERGISIAFDDIGRRCLSRGDAKKLLDAQRQDEIRRQDLAARREQEAVEKDRVRRALIPKGLAWHEVPAGMTPAEAMVAGDPGVGPRRKSAAASFLDGEGMIMHPIREPLEDAS